jgi:hypothetical protein
MNKLTKAIKYLTLSILMMTMIGFTVPSYAYFVWNRHYTYCMNGVCNHYQYHRYCVGGHCWTHWHQHTWTN